MLTEQDRKLGLERISGAEKEYHSNGIVVFAFFSKQGFKFFFARNTGHKFLNASYNPKLIDTFTLIEHTIRAKEWEWNRYGQMGYDSELSGKQIIERLEKEFNNFGGVDDGIILDRTKLVLGMTGNYVAPPDWMQESV